VAQPFFSIWTVLPVQEGKLAGRHVVLGITRTGSFAQGITFSSNLLLSTNPHSFTRSPGEGGAAKREPARAKPKVKRRVRVRHNDVDSMKTLL